MTAKKRALRKDPPQQDPAFLQAGNAPQETTSATPGGGEQRAEAPTFELKREHLLRKYWDLANLHPEVTKGTITGQLKALDSLCEELGMAARPPENAETQEEAAIYRSAWMRRSQTSSPSNA